VARSRVAWVQMTGAEVLVRRLEQAGVRWVFGIPSGPVLPLIEALRQSQLQFVLTASETSAGFMAATVGHLTGVPGVCVATVGPGATNLTTGVGAAWLDRAPALALTCNVGSGWLHRRIQMRIDHCALFRPLTKASQVVTPETLDRSVLDALRLAVAEPPGPVHLDLPEDVALSEVALDAGLDQNDSASPDVSDELAAVLQRAMRQSRRPLLLTGLGATRLRSTACLRDFVERNGIPFVSTLHAKGVLPESHPLSCGVLGRARRTTVQRLVNQSDLIIAVGFDPVEINYEEWIGATPLVHVDWQPADVSHRVNVLLNAGGDLDRAAECLAELNVDPNDWDAADLAEHRRVLNSELRPPSAGLSTHAVLDALREQLSADAILTYDVGAHTHQVASQWRTDLPDTCISTNGWSSMGFGMPSAYASKLVHPERQVVCVVGDGGFLMTVGELSLARRLNLNVPVVVLNDGWLGLMKIKQERRELPLSGVELGPPPESPPHYFGVPCRPVHSVVEFKHALDWALNLGGPSVIEAFVDVSPYSATVFD
jgi:acetolactate synthase-1/2/3 large subunit